SRDSPTQVLLSAPAWSTTKTEASARLSPAGGDSASIVSPRAIRSWLMSGTSDVANSYLQPRSIVLASRQRSLLFSHPRGVCGASAGAGAARSLDPLSCCQAPSGDRRTSDESLPDEEIRR